MSVSSEAILIHDKVPQKSEKPKIRKNSDLARWILHCVDFMHRVDVIVVVLVVISCKFFNSRSGCREGDRCRFAHVNEVRSQPESGKTSEKPEAEERKQQKEKKKKKKKKNTSHNYLERQLRALEEQEQMARSMHLVQRLFESLMAHQHDHTCGHVEEDDDDDDDEAVETWVDDEGNQIPGLNGSYRVVRPGQDASRLCRIMLDGRWTPSHLSVLDFSSAYKIYASNYSSGNWTILLGPLFEALRGHPTLAVFQAPCANFDDSDDRRLYKTARSFSSFVRSCKNLRWLDLSHCVSRAASMVHIITAICLAGHLEKVVLHGNFECCTEDTFQEMIMEPLYTRTSSLKWVVSPEFDGSRPYPVEAALPFLFCNLFFGCFNLVECSIMPDLNIVHEMGDDFSCGHNMFARLECHILSFFRMSLDRDYPLCHIIPAEGTGTPEGHRALLLSVERCQVWKPHLHRYFADEFRFAIREFLLCSTRFRPVLPAEITHHIIQMVAWSYPLSNMEVDMYNQESNGPRMTYFDYLRKSGCNFDEIRADLEEAQLRMDLEDAKRPNHRHERTPQARQKDASYRPTQQCEVEFESALRKYLVGECVEQFSSVMVLTRGFSTQQIRVGVHLDNNGNIVYENVPRSKVLKFLSSSDVCTMFLRSFVTRGQSIHQNVRMFQYWKNKSPFTQLSAKDCRDAQTQDGAVPPEKDTTYL